MYVYLSGISGGVEMTARQMFSHVNMGLTVTLAAGVAMRRTKH